MAYSLQGTARPSLAPRAARAPAARRAAIVASASRSEEAARSAVAGALSLLVAASPLVVAPASFAAASADAIAALEKESAARLSSCTTEECRTVINALNAKKMAKLTGAPPVKAAPAKKAAPKPAPALVAKPTPPPVAKPAPAPAAKPAGPTPAAVKAAADKKAAEKKAAEAAAEKKKKAEKAAKKSSGGTNPLFYTVSFVGKVAFAAGALAAPFIFLKKEEIIVDESGAIDTEKAISTLKGAATGVVDSLPNKDTVVLYAIGGLVALAVTDGIINLPLLNVLVGAPVQILGFITALLLGKRYLADGGDAGADAKALALKLNAAVPEGLPKPLAPETEADWSR